MFCVKTLRPHCNVLTGTPPSLHCTSSSLSHRLAPIILKKRLYLVPHKSTTPSITFYLWQMICDSHNACRRWLTLFNVWMQSLVRFVECAWAADHTQTMAFRILAHTDSLSLNPLFLLNISFSQFLPILYFLFVPWLAGQNSPKHLHLQIWNNPITKLLVV